MACEGMKNKRTLSDRRIQGNGKINFHGSQFLHFFFLFTFAMYGLRTSSLSSSLAKIWK